MMIDIKNINLIDVMPPNLLKDEKVKAAAQAIDNELKEISEQIKYCLLLPRLDDLDEATVDKLAWQFHVDFYDYSLPIEQKRNLIRKSIDWHRRKGTPYAVQEVVSAILDGAYVQENWEYGGNPYCFKVGLIEGPMASDKTITQLVKAINAIKNTRSHLDGVSFIRRPNQNIYFGGAMQQHKIVTIGPAVFTMPDINGTKHFASLNNIHKEVTIGWQTGMA